MSWSNFCLKEKNWSSLLQETSSTPWRHPVLTSCWGGKAGTLLLARSRSAQRRAPLFLESRPRGGDWSGLCFDISFDRGGRFFFTVPTWTINVAFSVQNKNLHMPFSPVLLPSLFYGNTKNKPACVLISGSIQQGVADTSDLRLLCSTSAAEEQRWCSSFPTVCITNPNPEEEQWKPLTECFRCWLSSPCQVALDAFFSTQQRRSVLITENTKKSLVAVCLSCDWHFQT